MKNFIKIDTKVNTNGKGLWSSSARTVRLTGFELSYLAEDERFGELRVSFDRRTWSEEKHGLIYTDPHFLKELREALRSAGFSYKSSLDVNYSEQGMQGTDFVSMDVGPAFISAWKKLAS